MGVTYQEYLYKFFLKNQVYWISHKIFAIFFKINTIQNTIFFKVFIMDILWPLNWRYSTKKFLDTPVASQDLHDILEAFRLAPSAFWIQPGRIFQIEDPKLREQLAEYSYEGVNRERVLHAPVFLVLAWNIRLDATDVDEFMENTAHITHTPLEELQGRGDFIKWYFGSLSPEQKVAYATNSVMLGLGFLLSAAAMKWVDVWPMALMDAQKFDEILGLKDLWLTAVFSVALWYRDESDSFAKYPKVRLPMEKILKKI